MSESERIETLRLILEREQRRPVSYAEAAGIGESLMNFFEVLAEGTAPDGTKEAQYSQNDMVEVQ